MSSALIHPTFKTVASATMRGSTQTPTPQVAEAALKKQDRVLEKAEIHFEKHRDHWVLSRYQELLKRDAPSPSLRPLGIPDDRTNRLMRAATHLVERNQFKRVSRIQNAGLRLSQGRNLDEQSRGR